MLIKTSLIFLLFINFVQAKTFKFKNDNIDLELLANDIEVNSIKVNYTIDDANDINGNLKISDKNIKFNLNSKKLEYRVLNSFFPKKGKQTNKKIMINWFVESLKISQDYSLSNVLIRAKYQGKFEELSIFDESRSFEFFIYPNSEGASNVYGQSRNAGEILRVRNISSDIEGGSLIISGTYISGKNYTSNLKIKNFNIKDGTKYEQLIKSTRFFDFVSIVNNSKKTFSYMEVPLNKLNDSIYINDAFVIGGMVGFTFNGEIDTKNKTSEIQGFYGPLYLFDKYVDQIPLFNKLLTNNKNEGLLGANFSVNKKNNETSVSINPLSIITPGKTKRIFKIFDFLKKDSKITQ